MYIIKLFMICEIEMNFFEVFTWLSVFDLACIKLNNKVYKSDMALDLSDFPDPTVILFSVELCRENFVQLSDLRRS